MKSRDKPLVEMLSARVYSEPGTEELKKQYSDARRRLPLETVLSFFDPDPEIDITTKLANIRIPVLVTHGSNDQQIPLAASEYMVKIITAATLYIFEDKGHLPLVTATAEFCNIVRRFVDST